MNAKLTLDTGPSDSAQSRIAVLKKEHGVWVYQAEPTDASIPDLIDSQRESRLRELTGERHN
jgi:hypothetical protein